MRIPITKCNNPATSGVDMSPELLVRMFETIDNVSMVKESTGDLSRAPRIEALSEGSAARSTTAEPVGSWTRWRRVPRACAQPRRVRSRGPASTCTTQAAQANC